MSLGEGDQSLLLGIADEAVVAGLRGNAPAPAELATLPAALRAPGAVFVTLEVAGRLNGCIGNVSPDEPLAIVTARNAWSAAFRDPRLPPLGWRDYGKLHIELSVLSTPEHLPSTGRSALLSQLRPGTDGLILTGAGRQAVFLPQVWEHLPDPDAFLDHLLAKAGLPSGRWTPGVVARRFTTQAFGRPACAGVSEGARAEGDGA